MKGDPKKGDPKKGDPSQPPNYVQIDLIGFSGSVRLVKYKKYKKYDKLTQSKQLLQFNHPERPTERLTERLRGLKGDIPFTERPTERLRGLKGDIPFTERLRGLKG